MKTSEKLNKLATFLEEKVKDENFNYATYGWKLRGKNNFYGQYFPEHSCGSTGCAAGWAQECFNEVFWTERSGKRYGEEHVKYWDFNEEKFVSFMGLDTETKPVNRSGFVSTDYEMIFADDDGRLSSIYGDMLYVPKSAVVARIREAADEYAAKGR